MLCILYDTWTSRGFAKPNFHLEADCSMDTAHLQAQDFRVVHPRVIRPLPEALPFGQFFGDYAVIVDYKEGQGWHNPRVVPFHPENVSLAGEGLIAHLLESYTSLAAAHRHYGKGLFEGLKAFSTPSGVMLHRDKDSWNRLNRGATYLEMPQVPWEVWDKSLRLLVHYTVQAGQMPTAAETSLYIRPNYIASQPMLGIRAANQFQLVYLCSPSGPYYSNGMEPIKIYIETRCARVPPGRIGSIKSIGNYHDTAMDPQALSNGCKQRLWLAAEDWGKAVQHRRIEEVGTSSFGVFVRLGRGGGRMVFRTPSEARGTILPSHTKRSVETLLRKMGIEVEEQDFTVQDLINWHRNGRLLDAMGVGTAASVGGISSIFIDGEELRIQDGGRGERTLDLYRQLTDIQYGRAQDVYGWNRSAYINVMTSG